MGETMKCELCGEPMPQGEEMFKFHGYSGPCPAPPLPRKPSEVEQLRAELAAARAEVETLTRDRDGWERRTKELGSVVIRAWALLRDWWQYAQLEEREEPFVDALTRALAADAEHDAYALAEIRRWRDVAGEAARLAQEGTDAT